MSNGLRTTLSGGDSVSNVHGSVIMGEFSWYRTEHTKNRKGKRKHITLYKHPCVCVCVLNIYICIYMYEYYYIPTPLGNFIDLYHILSIISLICVGNVKTIF